MRLGIYGGSFDPVHYGHLIFADSAREALALDEVWLIPAYAPPHKQGRELASPKERVEMLQLAVGGTPWLRVSTLELDRGGVSYTVDTLETLSAEHPGAELFFLMGGDSLRDLLTWKNPARICELAIPVVFRRLGSPEPDVGVLADYVSPQRLAQIRGSQIETPVIELSSTDLRQRAAAGRSLRFRTPRAVEQYIIASGLYRPEQPADQP